MKRAVRTFIDPSDATHIYHQGDAYPREGVKPDRERMAELERAGLIESAGDEVERETEEPRRIRQRTGRR